MDTKKLVKTLRKASKAYYNDEPVMSDEDFDLLRIELAKRDPNHPFLSQIGAPLADHLEKVKHQIPMGSLNNSNDADEYRTWHAKHDQIVVLTPKMDGSSIEIIYEDGKLVQALSRGDGIEGEDVTQNVRKFQNVPQELAEPMTGSVRGEAILHKDDFSAYFAGSANPRNAANGTVRRSDGESAEHLRFYAFEVEAETEWETYESKIAYLIEVGFEAVQMTICESADEVIEAHQEWAARRDTLSYEIDGMVARINDEKIFADMGERDNRPKGGNAYKFEAIGKITKLININWTIGHTGSLVPTGEVEPVEIGGVIIRNVLLNNPTYMSKLDIAIGDKIIIERAGDVIPHVRKVIDRSERILKCPNCGKIGTIDSLIDH